MRNLVSESLYEFEANEGIKSSISKGLATIAFAGALAGIPKEAKAMDKTPIKSEISKEDNKITGIGKSRDKYRAYDMAVMNAKSQFLKSQKLSGGNLDIEVLSKKASKDASGKYIVTIEAKVNLN